VSLLTRARDGYCRTHLSTFGRTCTRCESEALREQATAESVELAPEQVLAAEVSRVEADADDDADCL